MIRDEWIAHTISRPVRESTQSDGRIRRWARIDEAEGRYLRVVLPEDGGTIHDALFDRDFEPLRSSTSKIPTRSISSSGAMRSRKREISTRTP